MPNRSAASMTFLPSGTSTSRSSMTSLGMERTSFLANVLADFVFEKIQKADYRLGCPGSKSAIGVPNLFAQCPQIGDEFFFPFSIFDSPQQVAHVGQPLPAGRTPPAGLAGEEFHEVQSGAHKAGFVIENHNGGCTETVSNGLQILKIHPDIVVLPGHEPGRSASRKACLEFRTRSHYSTVFIDYFAQPGSHRQLNRAWNIHSATYAVYFRAGPIRGGAQPFEPRGTVAQNMRDIGQGFHI